MKITLLQVSIHYKRIRYNPVLLYFTCILHVHKYASSETTAKKYKYNILKELPDSMDVSDGYTNFFPEFTLIKFNLQINKRKWVKTDI